MIWLLIAVLSAIVVAGLFLVTSVGELLARRDVPLPGEAPTRLERVIEHARSWIRRLRRR